MRTNVRFYLASLLIVLFWTALEIAGATARLCFRGAALAPRPCPTC
jgi:hypothetical protein